MAVRQFSNVAVETTLSSGITAGASSLTVVSATGWPAAPFILVVEPDLANEELILVGAKAGAVFSSLSRGFGGTAGVGHSGGDDVKHVIVGEDLSLTYTHIHDPGTDDTAAITHADLASLGIDDHHARDHEATHRSGGADVLDHGNLFGLGDDDHTQYLTDARHQGAHSIIQISLTSDQTIPDITVTDVLLGTLDREDDPDGDLTHNAGKVTINTAGWYMAVAQVRWEGGVGNVRDMFVTNGAASFTVPNALVMWTQVSSLAFYVPTDIIKITVEHDDGSDLDVQTAGNGTYLTVARIW